MELLDLAQELGLNLKKTSNSKGGEYHSSCPNCGEGVDRFVIWSEINRYWCRRCDVKGDAIQFCRAFMNMSYRDASYKVRGNYHGYNQIQYKRPIYEELLVSEKPSKIWQGKALAFTSWAQNQLAQSAASLKELHKRGFNNTTIMQYKLGYAINDFFREREDWGLSCEYKAEGVTKKLWLPSGFVIPTSSDDGTIYKLKVRRQKWTPQDPLPKYVEISGSKSCPSLYGDKEKPVAIVLESELDAMLIQQEAGDICCCIALGGATKKPDFHIDQLLKNIPLILWCLDNDEAGKKAALWWRENYINLKFWQAPIGKSPGDAFKDHKVNLRDWILSGIDHYKKIK